MSKFLSILFVLLTISGSICAENNSTNDFVRVTLPILEIKDSRIEYIATEVGKTISKGKSGMLWPATKIVFSFDAFGNLQFEVIAIENSRVNMFENDEEPFGYFIVNFRQFIVATKDNINIDLSQYFKQTEKGKIFRSDIEPIKPTSRNPRWLYYYYQSGNIEFVNAFNLDALNREMQKNPGF